MTQTEASGAGRLALLMVAAFVDTLGVFLVLALLPYYASNMGASPQMVGLLVSAFAVAQMISAPLWGRLSDRWGRRPVILLGLALAGASYVVFALANSLWLLLLSRVAQGAGGGTVSVIFAYISDSAAPEDRAERIGWVTAATSAAAMIGPSIGSVAGRFSVALPGVVAAVLCLAALVVCFVWLPETHGQGARAATRDSLTRALLRVAIDVKPALHRLIWIYALAMLANSALVGIAALYLEARMGLTEDDIWIFFVVLAGGSLLARVAILGPLVRHFGEVTVLRLGGIFFAAGLLTLPLPDTLLGLSLSVLAISAGISFLFPCTTALVSRCAGSAAERGSVLGVQQAFGGLSRIAGPFLAGVAFARLGEASPIWLSGGAVIVALAFGLTLLPGAFEASSD